MKFEVFKYNQKIISSDKEQISILKQLEFYWLIDAEIESASISIENNTLIWESGDWLWGEWSYGIWQSGNFYDGVWKNGIWENGTFHKGKFLSGIWQNGTILGGDVNIKK